MSPWQNNSARPRAEQLSEAPGRTAQRGPGQSPSVRGAPGAGAGRGAEVSAPARPWPPWLPKRRRRNPARLRAARGPGRRWLGWRMCGRRGDSPGEQEPSGGPGRPRPCREKWVGLAGRAPGRPGQAGPALAGGFTGAGGGDGSRRRAGKGGCRKARSENRGPDGDCRGSRAGRGQWEEAAGSGQRGGVVGKLSFRQPSEKAESDHDARRRTHT